MPGHRVEEPLSKMPLERGVQPPPFMLPPMRDQLALDLRDVVCCQPRGAQRVEAEELREMKQGERALVDRRHPMTRRPRPKRLTKLVERRGEIVRPRHSCEHSAL